MYLLSCMIVSLEKYQSALSFSLIYSKSFNELVKINSINENIKSLFYSVRSIIKKNL